MDSIETVFDKFYQNPHMSVADLVDEYEQTHNTGMVRDVDSKEVSEPDLYER